MKNAASKPTRTCGFRISLVDIFVIVLCAIMTVAAWPKIGQLALLPPIVLGHFFLFCNVFRVRRNCELIWAGAFIINFILNLLLSSDGSISALLLVAIQSPLTIFLIHKELHSERYHGILCRQLNPRLPSYLDGKIE